MNSYRPLISVIIPAYNAATFLAEAIASIQQQAYETLEIIVIDDGSTDGTAEIAKKFNDSIRYVYQENGGPAVARNTGLKLANGEIIAFLDADDLWPENNLEVQLAYFERDPSLEVVMGRYQYLLLESTTDGERKFKEFGEPLVAVSSCTGLFKKSVFNRLGYFDVSLRQGEDVDLFMRLREAGIAMAAIEPVTLYYRIHGDNITRNRKKNQSLFLQALKKSLDRRREGQGIVKSLPSLLHIDRTSSDN